MGGKIESALLVMVLTEHTREWLRKNDPHALEQAFNALRAEGDPKWQTKLTELRRVHCRNGFCYGEGCDCKCGPCTARYGADGIWR